MYQYIPLHLASTLRKSNMIFTPLDLTSLRIQVISRQRQLLQSPIAAQGRGRALRCWEVLGVGRGGGWQGHNQHGGFHKWGYPKNG